MVERNVASFPLEIRLFGPFAVRLDGRPMRLLRSRKGQWLLALLTLRADRDVPRGWLAGTLWPESAEAQAFTSLRVALNDLRSALGSQAGRLRSPTPHTLCLDLAGASADVLAFDAAVTRGDTVSLEEVVRLYSGPLLEGCTEEWALQEREARVLAYRKALETLGTRTMEGGDPASAVRYLRLSIAADPYEDTANRSLMQALAASGDYASAVLVYRDFRLRLRRELNAEPSPETTALVQHLREAAHNRASKKDEGGRMKDESGSLHPSSFILHPSSSHLPRPLTRLIGRESEVREIKERLYGERLVTLTGTGGIGKTRLAIQAAEELAEEFADGAWFVDLAALSDATLVPQAAAATLGVKEEPGRPLTKTLTEFLADRTLLLVLDNCEHLLDACAQLAAGLLQACPGLRLLATSRQALGVTGELSWRVPSLSLPIEGDGLAPSALLQYEAVQLFVERAAHHHPHFAMTPRNARTVVRVCRRLDGIALALELAAVRVKVLTVEQIAERLDDRFRLLTAGSREALPRQQTLRAMIDWSYELLTEAEQALLRRLSVFAGGCYLEAAEAVTGGRGSGVGGRAEPESDTRHPIPDTLDVLAALVDKSLVNVEVETGEQARYRLLETIRQYGLERLEEAGEMEAMRVRHRDYFLHLAEEAMPELQGPEQVAWLNRLELEHDNLRAALDGCRVSGVGDREEDGRPTSDDQRPMSFTTQPPTPDTRHPTPDEIGLRLASALTAFWMVRGHWSEGRGWLEGALSRAEGVDPSVRAKAFNAAGNLANRQGDYAAARTLYEQGLKISREMGDKERVAYLLNNLGTVARHYSDFTTARALLEESLNLWRELGDKRGLALVMSNLGTVAWSTGDYAASRVLTEEALTLQKELGNRGAVAYLMENLGSVAKDQGDFDTACELYTQSLALKRELGDKAGIGRTLSNLGVLAREQGDDAMARTLHREALATLRELNHKPEIAETLVVFANMALAENRPDRAARLLGASEALRDAIGMSIPADKRAEYEDNVPVVRAALGENAFAAAWAEGRGLNLEQSIAYALEETEV